MLSNCVARGTDSLLTTKEKNWLSRHENDIRFAPNPSWPPADYIDKKGIHRGIVSDYIKLFENKLGLSFKEIRYNNWSEIIHGLKTSRVDFVGAIQKTSTRGNFLLYTKPYMTVPVVILVRNDYPVTPDSTRINDMKLAGVRGYASMTFIRKTYPEADINLFKDDLTALMQTSLGKTDGTVVDLMTASFLVDKYGINNLSLGSRLNYQWEIRFATRKELPELHSILDKLLSTIDKKQRQEIYNRWVNIKNIESKTVLERNYNRLIYLGIIIITVITGFSLYSYELRKQVNAKTQDLQKEIAQKEATEEQLKKTLKEREHLLAEIHHRVKNNLAIISGLLQLESMEIEDGENLNILLNSIMRIKSIAMIHEKLYATGNFQSIPFHLYVEELLLIIENKFESHDRVKIRTNLDLVFLNINLAVPAALLVNELITNVFKHASVDEAKGIVDVIIKNNDGKVTLMVKDDGVGLARNLDKKDPYSEGFNLIKVLASQLNAEQKIEVNGGTSIAMIFENQEKKGSSANTFPSPN